MVGELLSIRFHFDGSQNTGIYFLKFIYFRPLAFSTDSAEWSSNNANCVTWHHTQHKTLPMGLSTFEAKHCKNCECCPGHALSVNHYPWMSWLQFLYLSEIVNCVIKLLNHFSNRSLYLALCLSLCQISLKRKIAKFYHIMDRTHKFVWFV